MTASRKFIATFIAMFLLGVLVILPWWIGSQAETVIVNSVQQNLVSQAGGQIEIEQLSYDRGIFKSHASYRIAVTATQEFPVSNLDIDAIINHGPLLNSADGLDFGIASLDFFAAESTDTTQSNSPVKMLIGLDQSVQLQLDIEPTKLNGNANQLQFSGARGRLDIATDQSVRLHLDVAPMIFADQNSNIDLEIEGISLQSHFADISNPAAASFMELSIPGLNSSGAFNLDLSDFSVTAEVADTPGSTDRVSLRQALRVAEMESSLPVQSLDWRFEFERLPAELIQDYARIAEELQGRINGGQPVDAAFTQSALALGMRLLNTDFEVRQSAELIANQGPHESTLRIGYNGLPGLSDISQLDFNELIAALEVEFALHLDLDAVLASPAAQMIDPYVQQGYIVIENGRINVESSLRDSELTINGEVMSIEQFF